MARVAPEKTNRTTSATILSQCIIKECLMKKHYIYALSWDDKTKIGYTSNPNQRVACLCSQAGVKKEDATFSFYETINPRIVEKSCHVSAEKSYARLAGEWFSCSHAQAISIILSNVVGGISDEEYNPKLEKLLSDIKTSLTAGIATAISSDFEFSSTEFGDITVIKSGSENWFVLGEILSILGYESSPSNIIEKITKTFNKAGIDPKFHKKIKVATSNGIHSSIVINEQGLFEVLAFGQTKTATLFRSWVIQNIMVGMIDYE